MHVSRHWRMKAQRYNMLGMTAPTADVVVQTHSGGVPQEETAVEAYSFTGQGEVYSFSTVYDAPAGFTDYVPYIVALVKLDEGPLITAQLTDVTKDEVEIGMPVEMVTRKLRTDGDEGMIVYGYKFRPSSF